MHTVEGIDRNWQYIDGLTRRAFFHHTPSGTYKLHLRAADSYGQWYDLPYTIQVHVLTPWYATWWALIIYIGIVALLLLLLWRYIQMQRELQASRRFSTILQSTRIDIEPQTFIHNKTTIPSIQSSTQTQRNAEFTARATQLVQNHLSDSNYNRDSMAADLGMSVSSLYTRLRECTDLSIQTFIQTIRLNAACDILRTDSEIRISEVAYRVGFNTPKYFSQCFKKEFGMLPGEFVKQHRNNNFNKKYTELNTD